MTRLRSRPLSRSLPLPRRPLPKDRSIGILLARDLLSGAGLCDGLRGWCKVSQLQAQIPRVGCVSHSGFKINRAIAYQSFDLTVKMLHPFSPADAHSVKQGFAFAFPFFDIFSGAQCGL